MGIKKLIKIISILLIIILILSCLNFCFGGLFNSNIMYGYESENDEVAMLAWGPILLTSHRLWTITPEGFNFLDAFVVYDSKLYCIIQKDNWVKISTVDIISGEINYIDFCESFEDKENYATGIYNSLSTFHDNAYLSTEPENGTLQDYLANQFKYNQRGAYRNGKIYYEDFEKVASYDIFTGEISIDAKDDDNSLKLNYSFETNNGNIIIKSLNTKISKAITLDTIKESNEVIFKIVNDGNYSVDYSQTIMREFDDKLYFTICLRDDCGRGYNLLIHYDFDSGCFEYCDYGNDETYKFPVLVLDN